MAIQNKKNWNGIYTIKIAKFTTKKVYIYMYIYK